MLPQERHKRVESKCRALRHNIFEKTIKKLRAIFNAGVQISADTTKGVEYLVEVCKQARASDFGHVVQGLTSVIPHAVVLVREAAQNGRE
jgi:hypothetical protein